MIWRHLRLKNKSSVKFIQLIAYFKEWEKVTKRREREERGLCLLPNLSAKISYYNLDVNVFSTLAHLNCLHSWMSCDNFWKPSSGHKKFMEQVFGFHIGYLHTAWKLHNPWTGVHVAFGQKLRFFYRPKWSNKGDTWKLI